jgi:hypothetical protein
MFVPSRNTCHAKNVPRRSLIILALLCPLSIAYPSIKQPTLSDRKFFKEGRTFSEACTGAARVRARLVVTQKWSVASATCNARVWFNKGGWLTYSGRVLFSKGPVEGTADVHFIPRDGGSITFGDTSKPSYLSWWGATADGTDQTSRFQSALDSVNNGGGGEILISYSPRCYVVRSLKYYSNITIFANSRATCVQKMAGMPLAAAAGGASVFYSDSMRPVNNVHFRNFTIDGNRSNITGVTGDGGNFGIIFFGASASSVENMIIKDSHTDGIAVDGAGISREILGSGVTIDGTLITGSRRNNVSLLAGLNTTIRNCELSYAHGTSPEAGVDVEQYEAGAYVTGFRIIDSEIHDNAADGILLNIKNQDDPSLEIAIINTHSYHNGGIGLDAKNFTKAASLVVRGGTYADNAGCCAIALAGWAKATLTNETVSGSSRGVLLAAYNPSVMLGPSVVSGTLYDLSVDGPGSSAILNGTSLAHGVIQPGHEDRVTRIR